MLARKLNRQDVSFHEGTVVRAKDGSLAVCVDGTNYSAKRAKSCLVAPSPGDEVLVAFSYGARCFVLAILEGDDESPITTLQVDGDLEVHLASGKLDVKAARGIGLASGNELNLVAQSLTVSALEGTIFIEKLEHLGTRLKADVEAIRLVGNVSRKPVDFEFTVDEDSRNVELIVELNAAKGQLIVSADSLRLARL